jgi:hypothetical protein
MDVLTLSSNKSMSVPEWHTGMAYTAGTQVAFECKRYVCLAPHIAQIDWSPVAARSLWKQEQQME